MKIDRNKGFTLIELLVVVAVIGILAAVAIPAYTGYITRGKITAAESIIEQLPILIENYRAENGFMCPTCNTNGTYTFNYIENNSGSETTTTLTALYPDFRAKGATVTDASLYNFRVTIVVDNCTTTGCEETATFAALPVASRGAPAGTITSNTYE